MARAPFQVLVFPFHFSPDGALRYALFRRNRETGGYWQGIAGGGEGSESPLAAAQRETAEEAGIQSGLEVFQLDAMCMVPVANVCGFAWGPDVLVIPEYSFAVAVKNPEFRLSREHTEYRWIKYEDGLRILHWDSNKTALWELNHRLATRRDAM